LPFRALRPQTFFPGEGKIFPRGRGAKTYYLPKKHPKDTILPGQGGQEPPLALPCVKPMIQGYLEISKNGF